MSTPRADQQPPREPPADRDCVRGASSRRASLVVNLSTLERHKRSSVTTTTTTRRRPIRSFAHSLGSSFVRDSSPSPSDRKRPVRSPLDDLRDRLAATDAGNWCTADHLDYTSSAICRPSSRPSRQPLECVEDFDAGGPRSAPATLLHAKHTLVVSVDDDDDDDDDCGQNETTATIKLPPSVDIANEQTVFELTNSNTNQQPPSNDASLDQYLQVVELDERPTRRADCSTEPIVEVKLTSSSNSSSSSANSSPISSRQSSDCERRTGGLGDTKAPNSSTKHHQTYLRESPCASPHTAPIIINGSHQSISSTSSSSSESSSRKLIRRRTVRRSYHHRALEECTGDNDNNNNNTNNNQQQQQSPLLATTTTLTRQSESERAESPTRCQSAEPELEAEAGSGESNKHLSPRQPSSLATTTTTNNTSRLSTSRSSSKIATITTSSSSSSSSTTNQQHHHHLKKSSTSSHQTINKQSQQHQQQQQHHHHHQENMTTNAAAIRPDLGEKLDLSNNSQRQPESLFERQSSRSVAVSDLATRAAACLALEKEEAASRSAICSSSTSSSMRKSSEMSTSTCFNASSSLTKSTKMQQHQQQHRQLGAATVGNKIQTGAAISSSTSSSCETSLSRSATKKTVSTATGALRSQQQEQQADDLSSSHFKSSVFLTDTTAAAAAAAAVANRQKRSFMASPDNLLLSSPDVRSLVQELGSDFAEIESAMTASSSLTVREQFATRSTNELTSRLFRTMPQVGCLRTTTSRRLPNRIEEPPSPTAIGPDSLDSLINETNTTIRDLADNVPNKIGHGLFCRRSKPLADDDADGDGDCDNHHHHDHHDHHESSATIRALPADNSGDKIRELMDKAQRQRLNVNLDLSSNTSLNADHKSRLDQDGHQQQSVGGGSAARSPLNENEAVKVKVERIDQRMNDLCRKLESCNDTQKAIELLKIMIQTIEKAWSIPVCGDDLGFKLCSSLCQFGGLDMILGFIHEADARLLLQEDETRSGEKKRLLVSPADKTTTTTTATTTTTTTKSPKSKIQRPTKQLKLNLSKLQQQHDQKEEGDKNKSDASGHEERVPSSTTTTTTMALPIVDATKEDEDSDMLTSDLGLDSTTSVESLSYVSANGGTTTSNGGTPPQATTVSQPSIASDDSTMSSVRDGTTTTTTTCNDYKSDADDDKKDAMAEQVAAAEEEEEEAELKQAREEELVLLSAQLLSQCLTSENRDYIVRSGLDPVIKLACQFTTMKSKQSKLLLKRSALMRQTSNIKRLPVKSGTESAGDGQNAPAPATTTTTTTTRTGAGKQQASAVGQGTENGEIVETNQTGERREHSDDMHSAIGAEILQHLFKHSEETCSRMISLGALQGILYGCRSSHVETLRHCASALANLALYGGPDSQQTMIEQKAHVWLFPLAFNEDDNVQYYACLAIVVLAANQEIEADVLQSSTLDLVEPFVTSHEPRKFAESTTSHIHGQSAAWLRKLMPLLDSKREEARNLACFHFAMEAHIKREQGQTHLFKEIGSIEPLRRAGSSPIAIASKFACQALRLIGEREPHKLSQQVPLWTCDDVCEWVSQVGFERFQPAFRDSHVDGDLLLQLDEEMLKFDIGIENGIIRRRFLRELGHLKRLADYSSVDRSNLGQLLITSTSLMSPKCSLATCGHHHHKLTDVSGGSNPLTHATCCSGAAAATGTSGLAKSAREYLQYIYPIIQLGVTRDNIHLVDCDQLLAECKITNALHRIKLANSIRELQDRVMIEAATNERNSFGGPEQKTLDVFVSYRRSTGSQLASLLKVHLQLRGFSVFIDVERLEAGKFDNNLLESIRLAKNFILVLSPSALDRCIGDHECKDWVHKEIVAAMASNCNIIPIIDNFHWPDPDQLPEDMRSVSYFNGIRWIHDYQDACVDKVERFIRGELSNSSANQTAAVGCPSTISASSGNAPSRLGYASSQTANVSTPSIISSSLSLCGQQNGPLHHNSLSHSAVNQQTTASHAAANKTANHDHHQTIPSTPAESAQHPLANYANPYLNYSLTGNANPNIRLR